MNLPLSNRQKRQDHKGGKQKRESDALFLNGKSDSKIRPFQMKTFFRIQPEKKNGNQQTAGHSEHLIPCAVWKVSGA